MRSFRQRIAVQRQPKQKKSNFEPFKHVRRSDWEAAREFVTRAIRMYREAAGKFEPLSDEEKLCHDEILKYTIDLEILDRGTYEERKEVVEKYGRRSC